MEESILVTIKKLIGLAPEDDSFDIDLITHINSAIDVLNQLGVTSNGFYIEDDTAMWADLLPSSLNLQKVKTYMYMKVKKWFDPPQNGTAMQALDESIAELEWRINVEVDPGKE